MTDSINVLAQHPPAVKVGGRRLSVSLKPKHHTLSESSPVDKSDMTGEPADYPRPAPPGEEHQNPPHRNEDDPKKEKKQGSHDNEKKLREMSQRKMEATRPTKDLSSGKKDFGAAGRIAQPAGKGFGI